MSTTPGAKGLPWTQKGKRPREWFRKAEPSHDAGAELGTDQHGQDGRTSKGRKWFSHEWWLGHHHQRAADGSWSTWEGTGKAPHARFAASTLGTRAKAPTRASRHADAQKDYTTHLHRLESDATAATNGFMVTPAGKAKGIKGGDFFAFSNRPARRYMSEELRAWMQDGDTAATGSKGGGLSTFRSWQAYKKDDQTKHSGPWTHRGKKKR